LLQAGGHIGSMARTQMASSLVGLLLGLPFICLFGSVGIALSILLAASATAIVTWRAATKLCPATSAEPSPGDLRELVHLGVALQIGAILGAVSTYLVRVLIVRSHGDDLSAGLVDAGFYQAAFAVTGSLPGVIFSATSSDFYPRVAAAKDEAEAAHVTETQIKASLLLAMPVLTGLLTMGSVAVRLLYAEGFEPAAPLLDWFVWAIFAFLIGWPLGLWVMARHPKRIVALSQSVLGLSGLVLGVFLVPLLGVRGAAIAYFGNAVIYALTLVILLRHNSGRWISPSTVAWIVICAVALAVAKLAVSAADSVYWGIVPTAIAVLVCALLYFKALAGAGSKEGDR
jgi:PST family polysaccharide transporter